MHELISYFSNTQDPGVLEDVQRALRLKARREARHRSPQPNLSTFHQVTPTSDIASGSSLSPRVSPVRPHYPASPPLLPTSLDGVEEPDIDFSPSVAVTSVHPVPRSAGDGIFDWTGSGSEDEKPDKKWSLSIKRRIKEKPSQPLRTGLEKQGSEYAGMHDWDLYRESF